MRALLSVILILAGCSPEFPVSASASPLPPSSVAVTASPLASADTALFRTNCSRLVLASFVDAFNRGDAVRLATFFTPTGPRAFQWFYTPETPPYGPLLSRLPDYFAAWHAAGESWRLVSVKSGDGPSWHGGVDFAVTVQRTWPDRSVTSEGKGALDCAASTIFVFAIGDL